MVKGRKSKVEGQESGDAREYERRMRLAEAVVAAMRFCESHGDSCRVPFSIVVEREDEVAAGLRIFNAIARPEDGFECDVTPCVRDRKTKAVLLISKKEPVRVS